MTHKEWELLSAFMDGELDPQERTEIEAHLASCSYCSKELRALRTMKETAAAAPRRALPPSILAKLEADLSRPTWRERLYQMLWTPRIALPVGAAAVLALAFLRWTGQPGGGELPLEPLMAAHDRYSGEGLLYREDLAHPEIVSHLVAYNEE